MMGLLGVSLTVKTVISRFSADTSDKHSAETADLPRSSLIFPTFPFPLSLPPGLFMFLRCRTRCSLFSSS